MRCEAENKHTAASIRAGNHQPGARTGATLDIQMISYQLLCASLLEPVDKVQDIFDCVTRPLTAALGDHLVSS